MQYSIVKYSQIDKKLLRFEAEYYNSSSLLDANCFMGNDIIDFVQYGTSEELNEDSRGYPTLRLNEFDSFFIREPRKHCEKISSSIFNSLSLKKGDVLICRTNGNPKLVGKSAIVPKDYDYAFASYLFRVRPDYTKIFPTTLVTYLNSSIGRTEIEKHLMVSNQANFSPAKLRQILVPKFSDKIQLLVDNFIWESYKNLEVSINCFKKAQTLLLSELGLTNFKPSHSLFYERSFSETQEVGRFDADYYQPKYYRFMDNLKQAAKIHNSFFIFEFSQPLKYGSSKKLSYVKEGVPFLRIADLENKRFELNSVLRIPIFEAELQKTASVKTGDVLVSRSGTLGLAVAIPPELNNSIFGSYFIRIRPNQEIIHPEFLALYINSICGSMQLERMNSGGIQTNLTIPAIENILIVCGNLKWQEKYVNLVNQSVNARNESRRLLEEAKKIVEDAILGEK